MAKLYVCTSKVCVRQGSEEVASELESLCAENGMSFETTSCLVRCGAGPNIDVVSLGRRKRYMKRYKLNSGLYDDWETANIMKKVGGAKLYESLIEIFEDNPTVLERITRWYDKTFKD